MPYESINPYTEEHLGSFPEHSDAELTAILDAADRTFRTDWRVRSYAARAAILSRAAALLRAQIDAFALLATREMGKLIGEARNEVTLSADIIEYYARNAETMLARQPLALAKGEAFIDTAPIGTIFCIEPWNYPYYQIARVAAPNLMAGNTVVVKHAQSVPQCALAIERLFLEAGAPRGMYSNVFLTNDQAATAIADGRTKGVALTGSDRAGTSVAASAGKALKKSTMELGGSDAFIVLDDANIEAAVRLAVAGRMANTGQACAGSKRFIVHEALADTFTARLRAAFERFVPGDPADGKTTLGPLSSERALQAVLGQIDAAIEAGARVLLGGRRLDRRGYFLAPTLLGDVGAANPAKDQEFFAPVAMLFRARDEREAIALANDSPFGLGGSVITADVARGKRVAAQLETGMVFINDIVVSSPDLPFGGVKQSGFGRELSGLGIQEFVNRKLVTVTTHAPAEQAVGS